MPRGQFGEETRHRVSPRLRAHALEDGLDGFLRRLLGGEARPLVESTLEIAPGVPQIPFCLARSRSPPSRSRVARDPNSTPTSTPQSSKMRLIASARRTRSSGWKILGGTPKPRLL